MGTARCRRGRMPFLPPAIDAPADAVALLEQLVTVTDEPQTVALLVDRQGHALTAMQRAGAVPCDDLLELCAICGGDGGRNDDDDEVELLVIASWRPGNSVLPTDDDRRCWSAMLGRAAGGGVHLVDWLLVDGVDVTSMAAMCGR